MKPVHIYSVIHTVLMPPSCRNDLNSRVLFALFIVLCVSDDVYITINYYYGDNSISLTHILIIVTFRVSIYSQISKSNM